MLNFHFSLESYYLLSDIDWTTTPKNHGENVIIQACWKTIQLFRYQVLQYLSVNINCWYIPVNT